MNAFFHVPKPVNEPVRQYAPGSPERAEVLAELSVMQKQVVEIPLIIGGREVRTGNFGECRIPHEHGHVLARYHKAGPEEIQLAIAEAKKAWADWSRSSWKERVAISLKASELLSKAWRPRVVAATMLGQSKTVHQAEIDAACELCDFLRFNTYFMQQIFETQPESFQATWNVMEYRPLEGFVFAISPFNFTAIGGNLCMAPAVMGNVVLWKPASTSVFAAWQVMKLLMEAGLPDGVINFVPGDARTMGDAALSHPDLSGIHFTGSNAAFNHIWQTISRNLPAYRCYPRIVGETGGKDFLVAHQSAEIRPLATCLLRGAFEYQGQKCSATSRAYIPRSIWDEVRTELFAQLDRVTIGPTENMTHFMGAVIDKAAFDSIRTFIRNAENSRAADVIYGGECDDSEGYFIHPTVILAHDPHYQTMEEEIFGPVLTICLYDDESFAETLDLCDETSPYALTGGVFARDRQAVNLAVEKLRHAAGNFYINDKTTGAVVGHQPFGGARASGTNDKAGSIFNLLRWISVRTIKECFHPPHDFAYPFLAE